MYNKESSTATEFINHEEILETLEYAEANKNNRELIDSLIAVSYTHLDVYKRQGRKRSGKKAMGADS